MWISFEDKMNSMRVFGKLYRKIVQRDCKVNVVLTGVDLIKGPR